jgi:HlyD family secretion protein
MLKFIASLLKSVALLAIGAAAALYAPAFIGPLPPLPQIPGLPPLPVAVSETAPKSAPAEMVAETATGPRAPSIRVATAAEREIVEAISATGTVMPRSEAQIGSDVAGLIVEELYFDVGDVVKKGDRLARLDRSNLELQLTQIEAQAAQNLANLAQAESQTVDAEIGVKQAQEQYDRIAPLVKSGVASKAQRDSARNALDSAKAKFASANQSVLVVQSQKAVLDAQRKQTELQLAKTELLSPVDGLVLARTASIGQVVSGAAGPLFTIATDRAFEMSAEVAEAELARLKQGMDVTVALPGRAEPLRGTIRMVSPQVDARSRLGTVKVSLPADDALRNGSFVRGTIELARKRTVAIPSAAVLYNELEPYVQKVVDGRIVTTPIKLGMRENLFVEVTEGLKQGDEIVGKAGTFVANGDEVTPIRASDLTGATN